jgi:hypothetical protein
MTEPSSTARAERRLYCWGFCKRCRWFRRWYVEKTGMVMCPKRHFGGVI